MPLLDLVFFGCCEVVREVFDVISNGSLGNCGGSVVYVDKGMASGKGSGRLLSWLGTDMGAVGNWF